MASFSLVVFGQLITHLNNEKNKIENVEINAKITFIKTNLLIRNFIYIYLNKDLKISGLWSLYLCTNFHVSLRKICLTICRAN